MAVSGNLNTYYNDLKSGVADGVIVSMVPAVRTHVWIERSDTALNVSVSAAACDSLIVVPLGPARRVC